MKTILATAILMLATITMWGQWDTSGSQLFTHGPNGQPRIQGNGAQLELVQNSSASGSAINGIKFSRQGQVSPITESYFRYNTTSNRFIMSNSSNTSRFEYDMDGDGTLDTNGKIILDSDGTPDDQAIAIRQGRNLEFLSNSGNSEVRWLTNANAERAHIRVIPGLNYDLDIESQLGSVTLDGQSVKFNINDSEKMSLSSNELELDGFLDINSTQNTVMQADGQEAVWYNGSYFSWGFGGAWNLFNKPLTIGAATAPPNNTALMTTNGQEIKMVGDNSYIQWHTAANSSASGPNSAFLGSNQFGAIFLESNLEAANIDGETGVNFLVSDVTSMVIDQNRNVGIGTSSPGYKLQVNGDTDVTGELTAASDKRLKKDIENIENALGVVSQLSPKTYKFRTDEYPNMELAEGTKMGFIAQQLEDILPELVRTGGVVENTRGEKFNSKSVNYIELIPLLTKAIQEQQEIIANQKSEMLEMKAQIGSIQSEMKSLAPKSKTLVNSMSAR